jgi:hypothetical protein
MKAACKRNLLPESEKGIEIVGESIKEVAIANFVLPDNVPNPQSRLIESGIFSKLVESIKPKVAFTYKECTRCKECY